jgi:hypothetical protein
MSVDCPLIYECICVHGDGKDDLELCGRCKDILSYGMEIQLPFCCSRHQVCSHLVSSESILIPEQCTCHPNIRSSNSNGKYRDGEADPTRYGSQYRCFEMPAEHDLGLHIYMVGVGIQQGFILLFGFFAIKFHRKLLAQSRQGGTVDRQAWILLYALYATLTLITVCFLRSANSSHY